MLEPILKKLQATGSLNEQEAETIASFEAIKPFSLRWELQTLQWLGVLLLNIGLGFLVYENIDTIGHAVLIAFVGLLSVACFGYAWHHRKPFSTEIVESPTPYFDYVLMLGALTFLIFEGYLQFQYHVFGEKYGLATAIPTLSFFLAAYFFDHRGVLSLAITGLAAWFGVNVTPRDLLRNNDFNSQPLIQTGAILGIFLIATALLLYSKNWKRHFESTYLNFALHFLGVGSLSGLFHLEMPVVWLPVLFLTCGFFIWHSRKYDSFFFLLFAVIYGYVGLTYCFFKYLFSEIDIYGGLLYFIFSGGGLVWFLINQRKNQPSQKIETYENDNDSIQL